MRSFSGPFRRLFRFYYEGFSSMPRWGIQAWTIILVKLFIMFFILKLFFFPDFLGKSFGNATEKSDYVRDQLLNTTTSND